MGTTNDTQRESRTVRANFKLTLEGEAVLLVDRDDRGNAILDRVDCRAQKADGPFVRDARPLSRE